MKKILLAVFFVIFTLNCFSITIYLRDNNQLTGEIKKIDKQKIYISPRNTKKLFIVNKPDIKSIMDGEIDLTVDILTQKSHGRINYNSYNDVIDIELVDSENTEIIDYTANEVSHKKSKTYVKNSIFNDKREGFIFGFGVGLNTTNFTQEIKYDGEVYKSGTENRKGFATDFRIGYSPKYNIEIYYVSKVSWFSITNIYYDSIVISDGVGAIGISYFASNKLSTTNWVPSPYVSVGFGFSGWSTPFEEGTSSSIGAGFYAAFGYEFSQHRRFELSFFMNNPSDEESGVELKTNSNAFMLLFNYLWY